MIQALRGMKDIIETSNKFTNFIEVATNHAQNYGFTFIQTPIIEETSLYIRSVGETSDIVGKEMYRFDDKGGNDVSMRPEGTAGVVRAFVEKKLDKKGGLNRFFYHGPMFRYERPQKGRLRQFHQFGIESFGESSVYEDTSVITLARDIFDSLKIQYELHLNSLGCPKCMPTYRETLISFLENNQSNICEECQKRTSSNPIRALDCKNPSCQEIYVNAPKITDNLCDECESDFTTLKDLLDATDTKYIVNKNLVRGLDYYSKTAFEFVSTEIGAQSAIAGGGRYDRLVEFLDGKPTPAVGFAIGIERIFDLLPEKEQTLNGIYFGALDAKYSKELFTIADNYRKSEKIFFEPKDKSLKAHLKGADKNSCRFAVILGENEAKENKLWIKDLQEKKEEIILAKDLGNYIG